MGLPTVGARHPTSASTSDETDDGAASAAQSAAIARARDPGCICTRGNFRGPGATNGDGVEGARISVRLEGSSTRVCFAWTGARVEPAVGGGLAAATVAQALAS